MGRSLSGRLCAKLVYVPPNLTFIAPHSGQFTLKDWILPLHSPFSMTINWFYFCLFPKKLGDGHRYYHLLLFQDPNRVFMHASISSQRKQHPFFTNINKPATSGFPTLDGKTWNPKTMSLNFKPKLIVDPHPPKKEGRDSEGRERKGSWSELRLRSGNG